MASWVYDNANGVAGVTFPVGQLTTETSYSGGSAYVMQQKGFNKFGESLGEKITIPAGQSQLYNLQWATVLGPLSFQA